MDAVGGQGAPLDQRHLDAIRDYTGAGSREINFALRQGSLELVEEVAERSAVLSEALEGMPIHEGTVLRGSTTELSEADLAKYEPGAKVVENQFLSSTVTPEREFGGNVLWVIESKHGRDVADASSVPAEDEVLIDKFTTFDVLAKDYDPELGRWVILMEER
jgi:hypothetical protein